MGSARHRGRTAVELVERFGTLVYVVDEADVRERARGIRESFDREFAAIGSHARVYYAGKAFLSTEVARWVTQEGLNIDVCSGGELAVALAAGVSLPGSGSTETTRVSPRSTVPRTGVGNRDRQRVVEIERVAAGLTARSNPAGAFAHQQRGSRIDP